MNRDSPHAISKTGQYRMYAQQPQQMMQQQMMQQPQQMLAGVVYSHLDQSTFNPNLPMGNDLQIQVRTTNWLSQPAAQQMLGTAVGLFRQRLQERANRTPLHTWAYNRISAGRFQNQEWNKWMQLLADFLEFLSVVQAQNNPPQMAPGKAADTMFKCYLATCVAEQPQLMQFVQPTQQNPDSSMAQEIQKYSQLSGAIMQDIAAYQRGAMVAPQQIQQYQQPHPQYMQAGPTQQSMQLPPVGSTMQYQQPQQQYQAQRPAMGLSSMTVGQHIQTHNPLPVSAPQNTGGGATGMDYGGPSVAPAPVPVVQPTPPAVMAPVESYGVSLAPISPVPIQPQANVPAVSNIAVEELDRPIPFEAKDVILDPHYYTPDGVDVDLERPFDTIYSPGGVITRPAYQVPDWTVTRNDSFVYTQLVDPSRFVRFYTKWPDGMVQERIVEYTPMMDYMKHEINPDLKAAAHRPEGEVVLTQLKVHKTIENMLPLAEVKELQIADEATPVRMTVDFQGTTDMENEVESRRELRRQLGLDSDATLPSHEYGSTRTHLLELDDATFEEIIGHLDTNDLQQVSKDLSLMFRQGKLQGRVYQFINDRLTTEVNSYLKDVMSQDVSIDDFFNDTNELFDHLAQELGEKYVALLKGGAQTIMARAIQFHRTEDGDDVTYSINDNYINLQTGWTVRELTDAKIDDEAQLVSEYTHAALIEAIKGMLGRATPAERTLRRFRVITTDGAYLEIFRGTLVPNAFMFKRVA